jgi:hypothetical protein
MHGFKCTIATSQEIISVETASVNGVIDGGSDMETVQSSSEQTYSNDVRHQRPSL